MSLVSMCQAVFLPWFFFCIVFAVVAFDLHYSYPWVCYVLLILGALLVLAVLLRAGIAFRVKFRANAKHEPNWWVFFAFSMLVAYIVGIVFGDVCYDYFTYPYNKYQYMNTYTDVDVASTHGQQMMDAGRVTFDDSSTLDLSKSMGYKDVYTYCVAPISTGSSTLDYYDFWAVGTGCCTSHEDDFTCGDYADSTAKQGLRMITDSELEYYHGAVTQAQTIYNITSTHPLFFYWTENADDLMDDYYDYTLRYYVIGIFAQFVWQLLFVILAVIAFARMGGRSI